MALKVNEQSTVSYDKFVGFTSVKVIGVNPSKAQLKELTGRELDEEPSYYMEENGVKTIRISFYLEGLNDGKKHVKTFFLRSTPQVSENTGKVKVIDKYNQTAWVTLDQLKVHEIPVYSNGPARISKEYRQCLQGEEELMDFIRTWCRIKRPQTWNRDKGCFEPIKDLEQAELIVDLKALFNNNFKELEETVPLAKDTMLRGLLILKERENGLYQDFFDKFVVLSNFSDDTLWKAFEKYREGRTTNIISDNAPMHKYEETPSDITKEEISMPEVDALFGPATTTTTEEASKPSDDFMDLPF